MAVDIESLSINLEKQQQIPEKNLEKFPEKNSSDKTFSPRQISNPK